MCSEIARVCEPRRTASNSTDTKSFRFSVSPPRTVACCKRGAPVTPAALTDESGVCWLEYLIGKGVISEIAPREVQARNPAPGRDRYRVGPKAITTGNGVLVPGQWISAADLPGQEAEPAIEAVAAEMDWTGTETRKAVPGRPARTAISSEQLLLSLIERKLVIDTQASDCPLMLQGNT